MIDPYGQPEARATGSRMAERLLGIAAALLLVIGIAAAITGKDEPSSEDALELLGSAPDAAREAGTARLTVTTSSTAGGADVRGEGLLDFVTGNSEITMTFAGFEFSMKSIDGSLYMKLPEMASPPKPWVKITVPGGAGQMTNGFAPGSGSVTGYIDALRGVGEVNEVGRETVNGVATTHFSVVIDLESAMAAIPEENRVEMEQTFGNGPIEQLPMDVWLSDSGLPIRTVTTFEVGEFSMSTTLDLTDFGVEVDIQPPPADQVFEIGDMSELSNMFTESAAA